MLKRGSQADTHFTEGDPDEGSGFEEYEGDSETYDQDDTPDFGKRKRPLGRAKNARLTLSDEQEYNLAQWLQVHPELYDKSCKEYKDIDLKNKLWEEKAAEIGVASRELLLVWYTSMRTRFGKLKKIKVSNENKVFSAREQWILDHFDFMSRHIYVQPNRKPANAKRKMPSRPLSGLLSAPQPESGSEDDVDFVDDIYNLPTTNQYSSPMIPLAPPMISSEQGNGMAKGYGTFLSTFVPSLHPSLLTQFYQESWEMVMRYHAQSESLKEDERRRLSVPVGVKRARLQQHLATQNHNSMM